MKFMVKKGYKHKTSIPGNDAENYLSALLNMGRNDIGSRIPDLTAMAPSYGSKFFLEVKSGKKRKVVLNQDQFQFS